MFKTISNLFIFFEKRNAFKRKNQKLGLTSDKTLQKYNKTKNYTIKIL